MKKIELTKGEYTIVDDEDFDFLNQWKWHICNGYAARRRKGDWKLILMHRLINQTPEELDTDHINRNKLDNRRKNLRSVTSIENMMNRGLQSNNKSGYKGIHWEKRRNIWMSYIKINKKNIFLGYFKDIKNAIKARKQGEEIYWL